MTALASDGTSTVMSIGDFTPGEVTWTYQAPTFATICGAGSINLKAGFDSWLTFTKPSNYLLAAKPMGVGIGTATNTIVVKYPLYFTSDALAQEYAFKIEISSACAINTHAPKTAAPSSNIMFYFGAAAVPYALPAWSQTTLVGTECGYAETLSMSSSDNRLVLT